MGSWAKALPFLSLKHTSQNTLTSIDVKFIFDCECLSASFSGESRPSDKGGGGEGAVIHSKKLFGPSDRASVWSKNKKGAPPRALPLDPPLSLRLFSSADILQIPDVVRRVVFLLILLCFKPIVCLILSRETSEMFPHFVFTTKTSRRHPEVSLVNRSIVWQFCCTIDVIS